jgi:hypothetical protein
MAVNVVQSALSSRRFNRWFLVAGGLVLIAGVVAVLLTFFRNTATTESANPTGPVIKQAAPAKNIPFPKEAWTAARSFIFDAVGRENLAASYKVADSSLRGGLTLKQWKSGTITVPFYPVAKILRTNWKNTNFAHPREALINVILVPKASAGQRPINAQVALTKVGKGSSAKWLVDYFSPLAGPPVPHA